MFNPNSFVRGGPLPNAGLYSRLPDSILLQAHRPINISSLDNKRTRWDQPLKLVAVLYRKFGLPLPEELRDKNVPERDYPPALLEFIKRCYERCANDSENKRMEVILRKIIQQAESRLNQVNWADFEVPQLPKLPQSQPLPTRPMVIEPQPVKVEVRQLKQIIPQVKQPSRDLQPQKKEPIPEPPRPRFTSKPEPMPEPPAFPDTPPYEPPKARVTKAQEKAKKAAEKTKSKMSKIVDLGHQSISKKLERFQRFKGLEEHKENIDDQDFEKMTGNWQIVGISESLEKRYLRITSMPDPKTVRPERVLKKALTWLKQKSDNGDDYEYISEQFRSIRQDLTIQHIKNAFAVEVYEQNSKISLKQDDLGQYNQCQAALWDMYRSGVYFTKESRCKFLSYQLLSLIIEQKNQQLGFMLVNLTAETLESDQIQTALKMRRILKLGNYPQFFKFYNSCDELTRLYLGQYIDKIRAMSVAMIAKTFGEKIRMEALANLLGDDLKELEDLVLQIGGIISDGELMLKQSNQSIQNCEYLLERKKNVYLFDS